jgi:hypothetical protein
MARRWAGFCVEVFEEKGAFRNLFRYKKSPAADSGA